MSKALGSCGHGVCMAFSHPQVFSSRWRIFYRTSTAPNPVTIALLSSCDVEIERVRKGRPCVLRYDVSRVQAVLDFLNSNHISGHKVLNRNPRVLQSKPENMALNLEFLHSWSINVPKAVEACPQLLYTPIQTIQNKLDVLMGFGLDPTTVFKRFPQVMGLAQPAMCERFILLAELGLDAKRIVKRRPAVFGSCESTLRTCIHFFDGTGLDTKRILDSHPTVLGRNPHRSLRPIIDFITKDMGRTLEEINRNPACLTYSLEKRIKPRYRYMLEHGRRQDYKLSTLFSPTDERFAWLVARQPHPHYHEWASHQLEGISRLQQDP
jgi:mTERF domain-containing protein